MTERVDRAVVVVNGVELSRWIAYRIDSDLLTPADGFHLQVDVPTNDIDAVRDKVAPGAEVEVYIERWRPNGMRRALQMSGWIDRRSMKVTREGGLVLSVEGRDKAGVLCDSSIDPELRVEVDRLVGREIQLGVSDDDTVTIVETRTREGAPFIDVVRAAVAPWGIQVITDDATLRSVLTGERMSRARTEVLRREARAEGVPPTLYTRQRRDQAREAGIPLDEFLGVQADSGARFASGMAPSDIERIKVPEARPRVGETVWDFLDRHAKRLGLMMWMTPDARLVIGSPDYGQEPLYRLIRRVRPRADDPNTIVEGGLEESIAQRHSSVTVYGRGNGNKETRTRWQAITVDPDWTFGFLRPLAVKDQGARSDEAVAARGERELSLGKEDGFVLEYTVDGHGQRDALWAQGTIAYVDDERLGVRGNYYVTRRTFEMSRGGGTTTSVRLVPRHSIVL
jgi:prophage tail gpP-like protein